ncbi:MAG: hypothetical protein QM296_08025 [Bacillota bacterium]|nr:hypothetical protein [Bacillota bacterium]
MTKMQMQKLEDGKEPAPIGTFAVIVDGQPEAVKCDAVEIGGITYDRQQGIFHVVLEFGGYDSKGVFHEDPTYSRTPKGLIWNRDQHPEIWAALDLDHFMSTHAPATADKIIDWFHQGDVVTSIGRDLLRLPVLIASQVADEAGEVIAPIKVELPTKVAPPYIVPAPIVKDPIKG